MGKSSRESYHPHQKLFCLAAVVVWYGGASQGSKQKKERKESRNIVLDLMAFVQWLSSNWNGGVMID